MYMSAINRAQKHILLTNAYFIPDHVLLEALIDAAQRGWMCIFCFLGPRTIFSLTGRRMDILRSVLRRAFIFGATATP